MVKDGSTKRCYEDGIIRWILMKVRSITHGAISIVNAIPLGIGSTLGIELKVVAEVELVEGEGVEVNNDTKLINAIINKIISKEVLTNNLLKVNIRSSIPSCYGLKSSSAVSNALSLALVRLLKEEYDDLEVINYGIDASLEAGVTITGAFDDASASYFGGFIVTDNYARKIIRHEEADDLYIIILLPNIKRTDPLRLKRLPNLFKEPVKLAKDGKYWEAMLINGVLVASILGIPYQPIKEAMEAGAIVAGVSGNGPAITAVTDKKRSSSVADVLAKYGKIITTKTNNIKARVEVIDES